MTVNLARLACGLFLAATCVTGGVIAQSQPASSKVPDLTGNYSGRRCVPGNSDVCPEMNVKGAERLMTARGRALVAAFDEVAAPKYDCSPATLPIIFGDPYAFRIEQMADRIIMTYEKDDVVRTVWLDGHGHQPPRHGQFFVHGYSTGRYEGNELVIETTRFTFDPEGYAGDALNAPSSTQKHLIERYRKEGSNLRLDLTAEDPVFLLEPIKYTMEFRPGPQELSLPWNCDPSSAQRNLNVVKTKYPQDPPVKRRDLPAREPE